MSLPSLFGNPWSFRFHAIVSLGFLTGAFGAADLEEKLVSQARGSVSCEALMGELRTQAHTNSKSGSGLEPCSVFSDSSVLCGDAQYRVCPRLCMQFQRHPVKLHGSINIYSGCAKSGKIGFKLEPAKDFVVLSRVFSATHQG